MNKLRLLFLSSLLVLIPLSQILSQTTGKISGVVTDKSTGERIPFANVFVEGTTTGAASDIDGNYVIINIPPGLYRVTASVVGYQKQTVTDVRVNVDFTTRLNFQLSTGAVDLPTIVVQGERNPLIRQDLTNPTVAITEESIQELPVDQISDVISLQAGVVVGDDGALHVRGGYGNEIAYTLNGIALNDPYGNSRSIGLATNAVKEVSVSTGTFAAQYGNALSGVVNYVTKEGSDNYSFGLRGYAGDYFSNRTNLFDNINDIDLLNRGRVEATFGGPIPEIPGAKFYVSSIYENFKGSLYGIRLYRPTDSYLSPDNFSSSDSRKGSSTDPYFFNPYTKGSDGKPTGDGSFVPMNTSRDFNFQGNLSYKFSSLVKVKYEAVYDKSKSQAYSNAYKYNPDGRGTSYSEGLIQSLDLTHTIDNNIFYTLQFSYGYSDNKYYLFEDVNDPGYLPSLYSRAIGNTFYLAGGTDNYRQFRKTATLGVKGDMVAQLFNIHEIKAGFEVRQHKLNFEGYSVEFGKQNPDGSFNSNLLNNDLLYDSNLVLLRRKPTDQSLYTQYEKKPVQLAAYIQDKIELASTFILNAGLRYELFDPAAQYNTQISKNLIDSLSGNITAYNTDAKIKHTLSPRISISYPITDQGIIRFSYGHFYQIGSLSSLYQNSNYYVTNVGVTPTFGNANVEPQKSVQYEIGLQQQLAEDLKLDVTGFYKDVSNYIFTQYIFTETGRAYQLLTNLAYSNSRGITISLFKRRSPGGLFQASIDYTFSIAEGNRTEPASELFFSEQSGKQNETFLVPLDFDRLHVINATAALTEPNDWTAGFIFNLQTGTPYTPALPSNLVSINYTQNSGNQPMQWRVDFKLEKYIDFGPLKTSLFLQVENLFDTENELFVYASSGRALSNVEQVQNSLEFQNLKDRIKRGDPGLVPLEQIENYYSKRPERVNRPREVRLGFSLLFN
jgi:outer membrane receptor protein involved in Fe transport